MSKSIQVRLDEEIIKELEKLAIDEGLAKDGKPNIAGMIKKIVLKELFK
jgi:hypothetical protein